MLSDSVRPCMCQKSEIGIEYLHPILLTYGRDANLDASLYTGNCAVDLGLRSFGSIPLLFLTTSTSILLYI